MTTPNHLSIPKAWSERWFAMLQQFGLLDKRMVDLHNARGSRITRLEVLPGQVNAAVQDRSAGLCSVTIEIAPWTQTTWTQVTEALGAQTLFMAQTATNHFPPEIEQTLQLTGASLLPTEATEIKQNCTCQSGNSQPCPALFVVHRQLGEMLNAEPWLLLRLRGRDRQQILQALQAQRNNGNLGLTGGDSVLVQTPAHDVATYLQRTGVDEAPSGEPFALADQVERFWGSRRQLESFHHHIVPPPIELVLLRRLGPPTLTADGALAYEALSALYRQVTDEALTLAYASETSAATPESGK